MFVKLTKDQIKKKKEFIENYKTKNNPATLSTLDANANVAHKNIATLEAEINKDVNIQINRAIVSDKITEMFGEELGSEYVRQIEDHEIYVHDETSLKPYCVSVSMYPLLTHWMTTLWWESKAPKNIYSFAGSFVNLVFAIASQFAWAVATVEFLMYFDHFARKQWGEGYTKNITPELHKELTQLFQHVVYSINQPAAARGYQSVFFNISIFDKNYFTSLFGDFVFPDWDIPKWSSLDGLQKVFMEWFNEERSKAVLTFPVITAAMLTENNEVKDKDFADFISKEMSEGNSFFVYQSDSVDSLSACCRLKSTITDNTFSYSLWAWWVSTWSINVITINFNRLIQKWIDLKEQIDRIHKYQLSYLEVIKDYKRAWLLPVYDAGYISLSKQFLTIWINWMVEAAESLGLEASNNDEYKAWVATQLKVIYDANKAIKASSGVMFNTEFVPAENLWVKNSKWDKKDWLKAIRDCYNSYFYKVEDEETSMIDKFSLHWKDMIEYLDWWSALHLNLDELLTKENALKLLNLWAKSGCNYFTFNVRSTICNGCGYINKETKQFCTKCGSMDIDYGTRVIGYLKRVSAFSEARQTEAHIRFYN